MDRLVVIDDGRIVEDGTHDELIENRGVYASLWNSQVSGFIPD
jgi:ABC-type multidrug transport system fused ATPase/permease subunit